MKYMEGWGFKERDKIMTGSRYEEAGVSIKTGEEFVQRVKRIAESTFEDGVIGSVGKFAAFFEIEKERYSEPVLVSATDGVGTKLMVARICGKFDTVGIDLVAMSVNDILVHGAKPLFFLDYLAAGKLVVSEAEALIKGIAEGCRQAKCSLIGGETAEMPGVYQDGEFDLAGFAVGIVEKSGIIDGTKIRPGDIVCGLSSSGIHSNGYSLVRKVLLEEKRYRVEDEIDVLGCRLGEELLQPTCIYSGVLSKLDGIDIHGMAHITGGGWYGNIPRVLPARCCVVMRKGTWNIHPIFNLIQTEGNVGEEEMYSCFNMGIGFVIFAGKEQEDKLLSYKHVHKIGEVQEGKKGIIFEG